MKKTVNIDDQKIQALEAKTAELTNNWKRALADYQNLERRMDVAKEQWNEYAKRNIITKLLPVLDTLEQVNSHIKNEGLNIALKQFKEVLTIEGVSEIEALGKVFDPNFHECVEVEEGTEENKISKVFIKGYQLNGKVLRPASVRVIKRKVNQKEEEIAKKAAQTGDYM